MKAKELFGKLGYKKQVSFDSICFVYENEDTSDFEIIFDLKSKKIHTYGACSDKSISIDELNAIYKQCEELGWIEEEKQEKQETNYEHYKDKIIEDGIWNLALVNGTPKRCHNVYCNDCDFKTSRECKKKLEEWLKHPYKKLPYKLSQFEFDIIQTYRDCHESCKISEFKQLIELKDKGYFKCIDHDTKIQDVLKNCEVID